MKLFSRIINFLKQQWVIHLIIMSILIGFLWLWGNSVSFNGTNILASPITKSLLSFVMILFFGIKHLRLKKSSNQEHLIATVDDELTSFKQNLCEILNYLKPHPDKQKLPWYLMLGPISSGKTALLVNSGLEFPFTVNPPESYTDTTCRLSDRAVFLDVTGKYLGFTEKNDYWHSLINTVKTHGQQKNLAGIIVTYSLSDLLEQDASTQLKQLQAIQFRIRALQEHLGSVLPVYLVITKLDTLMGFNDFFADLNDKARNQILGITFESDVDIKSSFSIEYDTLLQCLTAQLATHVHAHQLKHPKNSTHAAKIVGFPLQMASIKDKLLNLIQQTFIATHYYEAIHLRGIYFTSTMQTEQTSDHVMSFMQNMFSASSTENLKLQLVRRAFFIQDLFAKLILAETDLSFPTQQNLRKNQSFNRMIYISCSLAFLGIATLGSYGYYTNKTEIQQLNRLIKQSQDIVLAHPEGELTVLQQLMTITTSMLHDRGYSPNYSGFTQGKKLIESIQNVGQIKLRQLLLPWLIDQAKKELAAALNNNDFVTLYQKLKIYLMLGNPQHLEIETVEKWAKQKTPILFPDNLEQQQIILKNLSLILNNLTQSSPLDSQLIAQARSKLNALPAENRAYWLLLQQKSIQDLRPLVFNAELIPHFNRVYESVSSILEIPGLYTQQGYQAVYLKEKMKLVQQILSEENWVLENKIDQKFAFLEFIKQVDRLYFADYATHWQQLLTQLNIVKTQNLEQTAALVQTILAPDSPLIALLQIVKRNMEISKNLVIPQPLNEVMKETNPYGFVPIKTILDTLANVYSYLKEISSGNAEAAYNASKALFLNQKNPLLTLQQQAAQEPEILANWLKTIVNESKIKIFSLARNYLNAIWEAKIYSIYHQIFMSQYPFAKKATESMAFTDFNHFFGPNGVIDTFFQTYLKPFVDTSEITWKLHSNGGITLPLSLATLEMFQQATMIKTAYFPENSPENKAQFSLKPVDLDAKLTEAHLQMGDNIFIYRHDPQLFQPIIWPNKSNNTAINLTMIDLNGIPSRVSWNGTWSFLKFFENCSPQQQSKTQFLLTCQLHNRTVRYQLQANSIINPFLTNLYDFRTLQHL